MVSKIFAVKIYYLIKLIVLGGRGEGRVGEWLAHKRAGEIALLFIVLDIPVQKQKII